MKAEDLLNKLREQPHGSVQRLHSVSGNNEKGRMKVGSLKD